jgi:predicted SAM-dependent methyltransferase
MKLDLGCGPNKKDGFVGVDIMQFDGKVDVVTDLTKPWPFADGTVEEVHCSHFLEHLTGEQRLHFFTELDRVLAPEGKATIIVPHWRSSRAYGDVTHQWPPVVEMFWYYLDKDWRAVNAPHLPLKCNFTATWGYSISPQWAVRSQESQQFATNHYTEVIQDMLVTVSRKK